MQNENFLHTPTTWHAPTDTDTCHATTTKTATNTTIFLFSSLSNHFKAIAIARFAPTNGCSCVAEVSTVLQTSEWRTCVYSQANAQTNFIWCGYQFFDKEGIQTSLIWTKKCVFSAEMCSATFTLWLKCNNSAAIVNINIQSAAGKTRNLKCVLLKESLIQCALFCTHQTRILPVKRMYKFA